METKVIDIHDLSQDMIDDTFKLGFPIPFPTETVFGLGAKYNDLITISNIFTLKQRPLLNPLIIHISRMEMLSDIAKEIPLDAYRLMEAFFPGPLTLILLKKESVSDLITAQQKTVAVRMPSHEIARLFIDKVGVPLVAPSANLSGKPSSTHTKHVLEDFKNVIPYIIHGEASQYGIESTIIDMTSKPYTILRPGVITALDIESILGFKTVSEGSEVLAPGMRYKHYEPVHPLYILEGNDQAIIEFMKQKTHALFIGHARFKEDILDMIVLGKTHKEMTKHLYHALRETQVYKDITLYTHKIEDEAYMNRLMKAANGRLIIV
jgi:L-threonylcarbamoyladenylate synthase